jgi:uncharacterized glyoxalase superfamily metalloenzyme YdcJ
MRNNLPMPADEIRTLFSRALSEMYRTEVPKYDALLTLVADVNAQSLRGQSARLDVERHGAIRLGSARELATMRRLFAVMGMLPTGYYDLSVAGVPVHATAFRPHGEASLQHNPLRIFTSLLRLELIADASLRRKAAQLLESRRIFSSGCLDAISAFERDGALTGAQAHRFVAEALKTFRWHGEATVDFADYSDFKAAHPVLADIVCFKGPHINHLTPRVLDIDQAQMGMRHRGLRPKATIEGPPPRQCPILLRQTSFLAEEEPVRFPGNPDVAGSHTARFGEIEQRGCALTPKGRALYDKLLAQTLHASHAAQEDGAGASTGARADADGARHAALLAHHFAAFPDDLQSLHRQRLVYVRYALGNAPSHLHEEALRHADVDALVDAGWLVVQPLVYEDFLPVSAGGIFRSNLGAKAVQSYDAGANQAAFEAALGAPVACPYALYEKVQAASLAACAVQLGLVFSEGATCPSTP